MKQKALQFISFILRVFPFVRFIKFSSVGLSGVAVNLGLLWILTTFIFGERLYMLAAVISVETSVLNNFYWNDVWTFRDRRGHNGGLLNRLLKFHVSRILGILTNLGILYLLTEYLALYYLISNIFAIGAGTLVNYLTSDKWVWRRP
ncbi:MAG TPA: GtrA family protein [Candidatus Caldiarchaeum subterraneum]|uniref:GtrA family protein n=1 Tax=Caldiarchaeum subterraneum TaxID=311458 RepID=A0A832ZUM7_CALS0|nr:GtrA family protein [Aigarchaeota archaeon]HIQ29290.1 GtrA family protein [Candidatus Caldarchaeum subterraneum]